MRLPRTRFPRLSRRLLILPPIVLGVAILAFAISTRRGPDQEPVEELVRVFTVAAIEQRHIQPRVVGYGLAKPARIWRAVARVKGAVIETHPNLNAGALVPQGAALVRIDPTDYELLAEQLAAEINALQAQMTETEVARRNDQAMLEIEVRSLDLSNRELARVRRLHEQDATSASAIEQAERDVLRQERSAQNLRSSLGLFPAKLDQLCANVMVIEKRLAAARRDLEWTVIKAPFDCRLASVSIENGQYVAVNEPLFDVHGVESMEIEARLPIDDLRKLVPVDPGSDEPSEYQSIEEVVRGLAAIVRIRSGEYSRKWPAKLVRIREQVDRRTRTFGVVVEVTHGEKSGGTQYPPLLEGTFCEVEFAGRLRNDQLVVPVAAVRNHELFIVNDRGRLERRAVNAILTVGDEVVVQGDLRRGESVVVGDPSPAVEGMLIKAVPMQAATEPRVASGARETP